MNQSRIKKWMGVAIASLFCVGAASAQISITLDEPLTRTYDGTPQTVTATTVPPGLANVVTYDGGMDLPTDAGEYDVVATIVEPGYPNLEAEGTLTINPKPLNVAGVTASDKRYDGTTDAVIDTSAAALVGVVAPDIVDLDASAATGAFEDKNFGLTKNVLVTGFSLTGDDVANYVLADPAMDPAPTARITRRLISVSGLAPVDRFYDGSVNVDLEGEPVGTLYGEPETPAFVEGDDIAFEGTRTGTMADKIAGSGKTVTPDAPLAGAEGLTGADADNYRIREIQLVDTVSIWKVPVTVAGLSANKVFDDTFDAPIDTSSAALVGFVPGDDVTVVDPVNMGTFASKDYGNNIPVTPDPVLLAAMTLGGADAGNYEIDFAGEFGGLAAALLGNIGSAVVDIYPDAGQTKIFGQEDPVFTFTTDPPSAQASLVGNLQRVPGEDVGLYNFDITDLSDPNLNYVPQLIGAEQFEITPLDVTIVPDPGQSKTYQEDDPVFTFTTTPDITIGLDPFTGALARDPGEAAGLYAYTMGTLDAGPNYNLALDAETFEILPLGICVQGLVVVDKIYNGGLDAEMDWAGAALRAEDIGADDVAVDVGASDVTGAFQDKAVGTDKPVGLDVSGIVLTGADAANYSVAGICAPVTGNITPKGLHVAGLAVVEKTYDGNTDAEIDDAAKGLFGVVAGDDVALNGSVVDGQFADPNVGTWDVLPDLGGLSLSGGDAVNYLLLTDWTVNPPPFGLEGDITALELTVAGALAEDKVYDGNADAVVDFSAATLEGVVDPDDVTLDSGAYTAAFDDKNVGEDKPVTVDGLALAGAQAGNYTVAAPELTASITALELTIGGAFTADDKTYDSSVDATGDTTGLGLVTPAAGDDVALNPVLAFADRNVGVGIEVGLTEASSLSGEDAGNYTLSLVGAPTDDADINARDITAGGMTVNDKVYNATTVATLDFSGAYLDNAVDGDDVAPDPELYTANFDTAAIGEGKTVTVTVLGLVGADAGNYLLGLPFDLTGNITPAPQTIDFPLIGDQGILDTPVLVATADSGLEVTFTVVSGPAYIDGGALVFTGGGEVTVKASQAGGGNWAAAEDVVQSFMVDPDMTETVEVSQEWIVPDGVYEVNVQAWGGGGAGGGSENPDPMAYRGGAGGGGGAYAGSTLAVEPGQVLNLVVASATIGVQGENGPDGGATYIGADEASAILLAVGGKGGQGNTAGGTPIGGAGGLAEECIGDTTSSGAAGGDGATGIGESSGAGGNAAEYGVLLIDPEGAGGASRDDQGRGNEGVLPGGGGGGSWSVDASRRGGDGAAGRIVMEYTVDLREPTTTVADDAAAIYGDESVELTATVTDTTPVNAESLFFTVTGPDGDVDTDPVAVVDGAAVATLDIIGWPAGDYPVVASYSGSVDFQPSVSEESTLTVAKADPVVDAWPTASAITYGQTLADSVLSDGVALVDGLFAFDAPATAPDAGTAAQAVTFTPDDAANYNAVASTVDVSVGKADPVVDAWPTASAIAFGQTLADSVLSDGAASVPGTFAFDDPALVPALGTTAQAVTFTPDDAANYNAVAGTVDVSVTKTAYDFDGDGMADLATFTPAGALWRILPSSGGEAVEEAFGWAAVLPVPGDYDNDGEADVAVYHPASGNWYLDQSTAGDEIVAWGWASAVPVPGDYDGDGATDIAVYHPATGNWYIRGSAGEDMTIAWGWAAAVPVPADYDGDGVTDIAVYHSATGNWYIEGMETIAHGWASAVPVAGDYNGDGRAEIAVFHRKSGNWYLRDWDTGATETFAWGWAAVVPVPADYDGDGVTDIAVYHPAGGTWYVAASSGEDMVEPLAGTRPVMLEALIHSWFGLP